MIPFKDDNPTERFPLITILFIGINVAVYLLQVTAYGGYGSAARAYGAVPHYLLTMTTVQPIHPLLTVLSSMFMHGSILHIGTNMLFLWIFGNNIEDRMGYVKFILFYVLCGTAAAYGHALANPSSTVPMIGASGAVSGVLGAYILLYPRARVHTLIFLGFFIQVVRLPAVIVIGLWIAIQFINGLISTSVSSHGGIAWFAHIAGFVVGIITVNLFVNKRKSRTLPW